ncbi:unnamed protein product (macronuclear) [Paramecium tetraurelia]|uniref:Uncharacterized protein n=2 Tax=Paramecium TaxID=5884 RepID=A0D3W4_PARTE|nr:uncharacterized protein GSPATT00013196001 [Paramecium tetraurelia]CAD8158607.1 unnamed protein product [Paramecium octaurelia]CAK77731.1 unnamed protein product [Paramecium tetraurelia]|eukprot:XP_001445128.1 hypothetical protein (macronuclear) [Paramecium tetraurelia strain d4-2]
MQPSVLNTSNSSFRLIKSKIVKRTICHGACIEEQDSKLQLNKSKKYDGIESTYSTKNLSTYLNEDNNKYRQPKLKPKIDQDAAKRFTFFHMRQQSSDKFQIQQTKIVTKQVVAELRSTLNRVRSSKSII